MPGENFRIAALNVAKELMFEVLKKTEISSKFKDGPNIDFEKIAKECRKIYSILLGEEDSDNPTSLEKET